MAAGGLVLVLAACGSAGPTPRASESAPAPEPTEPSATAASPSPESGGDPIALEPGGLEPGVRHVVEELGISFQPDEGWFAVVSAAGDIALSKGDVTVYVLLPQTIQVEGGPPAPAPAEPRQLLDAIDATPIVEVLSSVPFEAGGLTGVSAELLAAGGSAANPLLTSAAGEYGLLDGEVQWILVAVDGRTVVLSIERAEPDIDQAWTVAGPLVESIEAAP
jgi:hypothetical protein